MRLKGSLRHGGGAGKGGMTRTDVRRLLVPNAPEPSPEAVAQPPSSPRTHGFDALRAAKAPVWQSRLDRTAHPGVATERHLGLRLANAREGASSAVEGRRGLPNRRFRCTSSCEPLQRGVAETAERARLGANRATKGKGASRSPPPPPHVQRQAVSPPRRRPSRSCPSCPARERRCRSASRRPRPRSGAAGSLRSRRPRPDTGWRGCPRS